MGYWKTPVADGLPKYHDKPNCHFRLKPDGMEAIIEFEGSRTDYDEINQDPDCIELTRSQAALLAQSWNEGT